MPKDTIKKQENFENTKINQNSLEFFVIKLEDLVKDLSPRARLNLLARLTSSDYLIKVKYDDKKKMLYIIEKV